MKTIPRLLATALALAFATGASAQQRSTTPRADVPPPPGINDPGVNAQAPAAKPPGQRADNPAIASSSRIPALPGMRDDGPRDANGNPPPTVSVHHRDGDTIEEYREGGQLIRVRITPEHGIPYTYYVDDNGKLRGPPGAPVVKPVFYTIFKWGKPPAPVDKEQ